MSQGLLKRPLNKSPKFQESVWEKEQASKKITSSKTKNSERRQNIQTRYLPGR